MTFLIPQKGQQVKCFVSFNNSTFEVEGIVENWGEQVILKLLDNKRTVIIHKVSNIVLTEIINIQNEIISQQSNNNFNSQNIKKQITSKLKEIVDLPNLSDELKDKTAQELKVLAKIQEQEELNNLKKEHFGTAVLPKITHYNSQFSFFNKKG